VIGPAGGSVASPTSGVELIVPEGALPSQTPVEAELLSASELAALPAVEASEPLVQTTLERLEHYRPPLRLKMKRWSWTAGLAATGITWARLAALSDDEELKTYRDMFPGPDEAGGTSDVCIEARAGDPGDSTHPGIAGRVADVCDKGDLLEKLQWVFLSTGIAAAGIGTALLLVDRQHRREYALSVSPRLSRSSAGLSARLTF